MHRFNLHLFRSSSLTLPCFCCVRLSSTDEVLSTLRSQVSRVQSEEEVRRLLDVELEAEKDRVMGELKAKKLTAPMGSGGGAGGNGGSGGAGAYEDAFAGPGGPRKSKKTAGKTGGIMGGIFNRGPR